MLHCSVRLWGPMALVARHRQRLVGAESHRAVIDDDVVGADVMVIASSRVVVRQYAAPHAQEAHDDVAPADRELAAAYADAAAGRGLARDRDVPRQRSGARSRA